LSALILFEVQEWAPLTVGLAPEWTPPANVSMVFVFGDNDASSNGRGSAGDRRELKRCVAEEEVT
jgi:hypothetical protein